MLMIDGVEDFFYICRKKQKSNVEKTYCRYMIESILLEIGGEKLLKKIKKNHV